MSTMNVSLSEILKAFVDAQVQERGYSTASEYIRDLIRNDQIKQGEQRLVALLQDGLASGAPQIADEDYWNQKKAAFKARHAEPRNPFGYGRLPIKRSMRMLTSLLGTISLPLCDFSMRCKPGITKSEHTLR